MKKAEVKDNMPIKNYTVFGKIGMQKKVSKSA